MSIRSLALSDLAVVSALLFSFWIAGCGLESETFEYTYGAQCFHLYRAQPIDTEAVNFNVALVQNLFAERFGIDFCGRVGTVHLVLTENSFDVFGKDTGGFTVFSSGVIKLTHTLSNLMHECLHLWDFRHWAIGSTWHERWNENGYNAAWEAYVDQMRWPGTNRIQPISQ